MKDEDLEGPSVDDPQGVLSLTRNTGTMAISQVKINGRMIRIESIYIFGQGLQQSVHDLGKAD